MTCADLGFWTPLWNGSACVACPEDTPNWDRDAGKCVDTCPPTAPLVEGTICYPCPEAMPSLPKWNGTMCTSCGDGLYWTGDQCSSTCP